MPLEKPCKRRFSGRQIFEVLNEMNLEGLISKEVVVKIGKRLNKLDGKVKKGDFS